MLHPGMGGGGVRVCRSAKGPCIFLCIHYLSTMKPPSSERTCLQNFTIILSESCSTEKDMTGLARGQEWPCAQEDRVVLDTYMVTLELWSSFSLVFTGPYNI